ASTSTSWILSAFGCRRRSRTRATTTPSRGSLRRCSSSTGVPRSSNAAAIASGGTAASRNSWSQEDRTFIGGLRWVEASELLQEADVGAGELAQVGDALARGGQPVEAEPEREARPRLWVDAAVAQHVGMHH